MDRESSAALSSHSLSLDLIDRGAGVRLASWRQETAKDGTQQAGTARQWQSGKGGDVTTGRKLGWSWAALFFVLVFAGILFVAAWRDLQSTGRVDGRQSRLGRRSRPEASLSLRVSSLYFVGARPKPHDTTHSPQGLGKENGVQGGQGRGREISLLILGGFKGKRFRFDLDIREVGVRSSLDFLCTTTMGGLVGFREIHRILVLTIETGPSKARRP